MAPKFPHPLRRIRRTTFEHEQLTSLINSMADGVLALDRSMKIILTNGAALNILDMNNAPVGKDLGNVLNLYDRNNQPINAAELVKNAKTPTTNRDLLLHYADGSNINLYLSIAPVHLGYGKRGTRGYVILLRDITHEKSLEEERDEFISVVSHELRTPITIAEANISNAQFVAEKSSDKKMIKEALYQAHEQTVFLSSMINDLATLSRAERGKLTFDIETIDLKALLADLQSSYGPQAKAKGLTLTTICKSKKEVVFSSYLYLREILQNFVTNALKYTEKGHIDVVAEDDGGDTVKFSVSDTGIGISKGDQEKVFDKFFRSEDFRTRKTTGTGLGLYVTVKLAELIHAEMDVDSELNKGSTFIVTVPNLK